MVGISKIIRTLVTSDFLLQSGWGLIGPIFAIFITRNITGGTLAMVGFVAATYWITKSIVQPFIAYFFDLRKGEKDDYIFLIVGMFVANLVPLGYLFSSQIWQIFLLEFVRGLAMACVVPSWAGIFTRHISKGWEAFTWSIESTAISFSFGLAAAFGGIIASALGFKAVFVLVSILGLSASFSLLLIRHKIFPKKEFAPRVPPSEKSM